MLLPWISTEMVSVVPVLTLKTEPEGHDVAPDWATQTVLGWLVSGVPVVTVTVFEIVEDCPAESCTVRLVE